MAQVVLSSVGTLAEVLPFLPLGRALRRRGHQVVVAVNRAVQDLVRAAGLDVVDCGRPFGPREARQPVLPPPGNATSVVELKKWEALLHDVPSRYHDLSRACAGADLLIANSHHYAALLVHERLGIPWVCVSFWPGQFARSGDSPPLGQPAPRAGLNLLALSPAFAEPSPYLYPGLVVTGFWFHDGEEQVDWQPTPDLRSFVETGDRPLVYCLGSLPEPDAARRVELHAQAAQLLGKRLVVQSGWADLDQNDRLDRLDRTRIRIVPHVAHDWLFRHAEAVIHPGGIGVTARALKQGCPMLLEPVREDHYQHALLVRRLGVGFALSPRHLTPNNVARMLSERVCTPTTRAAAGAVAARLAVEDGIAAACEQIGRLLATLNAGPGNGGP